MSILQEQIRLWYSVPPSPCSFVNEEWVHKVIKLIYLTCSPLATSWERGKTPKMLFLLMKGIDVDSHIYFCCAYTTGVFLWGGNFQKAVQQPKMNGRILMFCILVWTLPWSFASSPKHGPLCSRAATESVCEVIGYRHIGEIKSNTDICRSPLYAVFVNLGSFSLHRVTWEMVVPFHPDFTERSGPVSAVHFGIIQQMQNDFCFI